MGITLRNTKGSALDFNELDGNFIYLSQSYTTTSSFNSFSSSYNSGSFTGSFTGDFSGTSSWANNALTASSVNELTQNVSVVGVISASKAGKTNQIILGQDGNIEVYRGAGSGYIDFKNDAGEDYDVRIGQISSNAQFGIALDGSSGYVFKVSSSLVEVSSSLSVQSGITGSLFGTSSWANNASTASYILNAVSSSFATTASFATAASFVRNAQTASYVLNAVSSSFASTASFVRNAQTASYILNAVSSSFASTASYVLNAVSSSFASTASYVLNAVSSSFATTASFSTTSSYILNAVSSSFASTASYVLDAVSSSFASTASYVLNAVSSSFASTASYVLNAVSSSFASTASSVNILNQNVTITGSLTVSGSNIYNTGSILIGDGLGTEIKLNGSDGSIEICRDSALKGGNAYIDFKNNISEDYDVRIGQVGNANAFGVACEYPNGYTFQVTPTSTEVTGSLNVNDLIKLTVRTTNPNTPAEGMIMASGSAGSSKLYYYDGSTWNALF